MRSLYISFRMYPILYSCFPHLLLSAMLTFSIECNAHIHCGVQCSHLLLRAMLTSKKGESYGKSVGNLLTDPISK